jgi:hypothetical protein
MESFNGSVSADYSAVVFSGKATAEFRTEYNSKKTRFFAKGLGIHTTRDESLKKTAPSALRPLLDDDFISDINTKSAAYILASYGTHLIARCYWGGTAEFNYSYAGTELTGEQDIKAGLDFSYGGGSAQVNVENSRKATELNNNSNLTLYTCGGDNTSFTTVEQFNAGYAAWVASIPARPDLCGIPNLDNDLIPIWTIAETVNPSKAAEIHQAFRTQAQTQGTALRNYKYVPPATTYSYITDLDVKRTSSEAVPSGYTNLVKKDMYNPDNTNVLCANAGIWGSASWLRIAYKKVVGNGNHNAIADLAVVSTGSSQTPPSRSGWTTINIDLNEGTPGVRLWLQYRKVNSSDTQAVDFIGSYCEDGPASGQILSGYSWVSGLTDLNAGCGGKYVYLTMHKSPFTW